MFMYFSLAFDYKKVPALCMGRKNINRKWTPATKGRGGGQNRLKMHEYPLWRAPVLVKVEINEDTYSAWQKFCGDKNGP